MADIQPKTNPGLRQNGCHSASPDYKLLTEIHQIEAISSEWDVLLARSRCNRAYSSSKWYLATVELMPKLQPLVFIAYRDRVLSGILPFWLEANRRLARFGDNYLEHLDIIAHDNDSEVISGLLHLALEGTGSYDYLVPGTVLPDSNFVKGAIALGLGHTVDEFFVPGKSLTYAVLDLTRKYDDYMKTLSPGFQHNLHRAYKRATRDGLTIRELTPAELRPELLPDTFLSLHLSRFGDRSDVRSSEPWIRRLFPSLFAEGRIRVFAILKEGRIAAIDLETVTRSGMYGFLGGFLPEIRRYGPGKLLIHKVIQQAYLEGMREYDFGWWGQDYKADWNPAMREVGEIRLATGPLTHAGSKEHQGITLNSAEIS
jgi:hypothetical protein